MTDRAEWVLIANPVAGGGRARRAAERAAVSLEQVGVQVRVEITRERGDTKELARQ